MATVEPVTLLERLRKARDWHASESYFYDYELVGDALDALPAVVALIEAAQKASDCLPRRPREAQALLRAATEPFVSTQEAAA